MAPRGRQSTVARGVAAALGITYLDSGAMYRCVALASLHAGLDPGDVEAVTGLAERVRIGFEGERVLLDDEDVTSAIRDQDVTAAASRVSVHPGVRAAMVAASAS